MNKTLGNILLIVPVGVMILFRDGWSLIVYRLSANSNENVLFSCLKQLKP